MGGKEKNFPIPFLPSFGKLEKFKVEIFFVLCKMVLCFTDALVLASE